MLTQKITSHIYINITTQFLKKKETIKVVGEEQWSMSDAVAYFVCYRACNLKMLIRP